MSPCGVGPKSETRALAIAMGHVLTGRIKRRSSAPDQCGAARDALIYSEKSCLPKAKPSKIKTLDSRLRGNDACFSVSPDHIETCDNSAASGASSAGKARKTRAKPQTSPKVFRSPFSTGPAGMKRRSLASRDASPLGVCRIFQVPKAASTIVLATPSGWGAFWTLC